MVERDGISDTYFDIVQSCKRRFSTGENNITFSIKLNNAKEYGEDNPTRELDGAEICPPKVEKGDGNLVSENDRNEMENAELPAIDLRSWSPFHANLENTNDEAATNDGKTVSVSVKDKNLIETEATSSPDKRNEVNKVSGGDLKAKGENSRGSGALSIPADGDKAAQEELHGESRETLLKRLLGIEKESSVRPHSYSKFGTALNANSAHEDSTIRLMKAKIGSLQQELSFSIKDCVQKHDRIAGLQKSLKSSEEECELLRKKNALEERRIAQLQGTSDDLAQNCATLVREMKLQRAENERLARARREAEARNADLERRLSQSTAEHENLRVELAAMQSRDREMREKHQLSVVQLTEQKASVDRQVTQLLGILRKQVLLVHNLKRQRQHGEAVAALRITEEEFVRALDRF